jgi:hypothetical protein
MSHTSGQTNLSFPDRIFLLWSLATHKFRRHLCSAKSTTDISKQHLVLTTLAMDPCMLSWWVHLNASIRSKLKQILHSNHIQVLISCLFWSIVWWKHWCRSMSTNLQTYINSDDNEMLTRSAFASKFGSTSNSSNQLCTWFLLISDLLQSIVD